ncbi:MAG TPA: Crp/Fnr family transcriptional regulator [Bacteroidales bacterium]|nr:Crp/Fnr family transcriptional regulator [Bacteroidales bacterium]
MDNIYSELSKSNIFNGIKEETILELMKDRPFRIKEYSRDEYVAYSHDVCNDMLIVIKGSVRGEMTDFTGKRLKIEDIVAPRPLAAAFIFGRENRYPVDIIANEQATVIVIPRDVLIYLLQHSELVLKNYLNVISSRTQFLSGKIRFLSFRTIREKIANYLLGHGGYSNNSVTLTQSQSELADFFGVTRPSLARALADMEEEGIIRAERREITILNREKLNKLLAR